jgi:hypothetical protein
VLTAVFIFAIVATFTEIKKSLTDRQTDEHEHQHSHSGAHVR